MEQLRVGAPLSRTLSYGSRLLNCSVLRLGFEPKPDWLRASYANRYANGVNHSTAPREPLVRYRNRTLISVLLVPVERIELPVLSQKGYSFLAHHGLTGLVRPQGIEPWLVLYKSTFLTIGRRANGGGGDGNRTRSPLQAICL